MYQLIPINQTSSIVFSRDDHQFREVLDAFPTTSFLYITTFNLSTRSEQHELLDLLKNTRPDCDIRLITNIPGRYRGSNSTETYKKLLAPSKHPKNLRVLFSFPNHSKMILTDSITYLGSGNFSDESAQNYEIGLLTRDPAVIARLREDVFSEIESTTTGYFSEAVLRTRRDLLGISRTLLDFLNALLQTKASTLKDLRSYFRISNNHTIHLTPELFSDLSSYISDLSKFTSYIHYGIASKSSDLFTDIEKTLSQLHTLLSADAALSPYLLGLLPRSKSYEIATYELVRALMKLIPAYLHLYRILRSSEYFNYKEIDNT